MKTAKPQIIISLCLLLLLAGCERASFYTSEANLRANFYGKKEDFKAFTEALNSHPSIDGAYSCPPSSYCQHVDENGKATDEPPYSYRVFAPLLDKIGRGRYTFFSRNDKFTRVILNHTGGRIGGFRLDLEYVYWPNPDSTFVSCKNYTPPTEDFYSCYVELDEGWMIAKSGLNYTKLSKCSRKITDCQMDGGTRKSCTPAECTELIPDW